MLYDLNPVARHLNQGTAPLRCPGGGISGTPLSFDFESQSDLDAWGAGGDALGLKNGGTALTNANGQGEVSSIFTYTGDRGVTLSFDMVEAGNWDNESFYITVNDQKIDLGRFNASANGQQTTASGSAGGATWKKAVATGAAPNVIETGGSSSTVAHAQVHTYEVYIPHEVIEGYAPISSMETLKIGFSSDAPGGDELFAVDNLTIAEADLTPETSTHHFDHQDAANVQNEFLRMTLPSLSNLGDSQLGTAYDNVQNAVEANIVDPFAVVANEINGEAFGDPEYLSNFDLVNLANTATNSLETWGNLDTYSEKMWEALDNKYAPAEEDGFGALDWILLAGNIFAPIKAFATAEGGKIGAFDAPWVDVALLIGKLIENTQDELDVSNPRPLDTNFTTVDFSQSFQQIHDELSDRGLSLQAESFAASVQEGAENYADLLANAALLELVDEINGNDKGAYDETHIQDHLDFIEDLGFTVTKTTRSTYEDDDWFPEEYNEVRVRVTDGERDLNVDALAFMYDEYSDGEREYYDPKNSDIIDIYL